MWSGSETVWGRALSGIADKREKDWEKDKKEERAVFLFLARTEKAERQTSA